MFPVDTARAMTTDPNDRTATLQPRSESGSVHDAADPLETLLPVDDPDRYEQIREHARGGLGRIVRAIDRRLGRTVAVKELLRRDDWHEARFVREALITARLEHPGIVPVHEAGRWPNGDPYYVMKLVEGRTLKELMASHQTPRERLGLLQHVIAVADAVGYAHSEGVVHRDVKPSNVIVGSFGETIVVDWGLARDCRRDVEEPSHDVLAEGSGVSTISGKVVGTPAYMAPEQARGELVDARADVYAIGAVLYELLAGTAPHHDQTPKAMLDRVIAGPPAPLPLVAPQAPRELADIIAKAMARRPQDRYANATMLAEDLRAFQTGKLVTAHTYTSWQLVRKKLAQHRGVVVVAIASAVALGAVGVESFRQVVAERDIAQGERGRAETAAESAQAKQRQLVLVQAETSLSRDPTAALAWLKQYSSSADREQVVDVIDEATALGVARHVFRPGGWVLDAQFTPDSKGVIAVAKDGSIRRYDLATHAMTLIGHASSDPEIVAVSPDGLSVVTGGLLGEVDVWPIAGGAMKPLAKQGKRVTGLAFDPSGTHLLVDREYHAELLDLNGNITRIGPEQATKVVVARDDWTKRAALVSPNQVAVGSGDPDRVIAQTDRAIALIALSPNGETVLIHDGKSLYSVPYAGGALTKLAAYDKEINAFGWSHDQHQLAVAGKLVDVPVIDLVTHEVRQLRGHTDQIYTAEFTRDGHTLLTGSDDSTARVWNLLDGSSIVLRGHDDDVWVARLSADEKLAATASLDGTLRVWPLVNSETKILLEGKPISMMTVKRDIALVRTENSLARWNLATGEREPLLSWAGGLGKGEPSPDGQRLLALGPKWTLELRTRDGKPPLVLAGHRGTINQFEWSPDGSAAYSGSADGTLRKWDLATGTSTVLIEGDEPIRGFAVAHDNRIAANIGSREFSGVMIYPDGHTEALGKGPTWCVMRAHFDTVRDRLLLQRCDNSIGMLDGKRLVNLETGGNAAESLNVSLDGTLIAGAMSDRSIRIWDANGVIVTNLHGHADLVLDVAFSPDGTKLASASYDKTVRIWDLVTKRHRVLRGHSEAVDQVVWRDADHVVTSSLDGTVREWLVPRTEPPSQAELGDRLDAATSATIDRDNRATTIGG